MSIIFTHLPVIPLRITSPFGKRNTGIVGASTFHHGIDLGRDFAKSETAILSVADGVVYANYWNDYKGWVIIIDHGNYKTLYQHLKLQSPLVKGKSIVSGQQIGIMGASTKKIKNMAMHLHMELIVNGTQIDPQPYLEMANLANQVKLKFGLSDGTLNYLEGYQYAEALFTKLLAGNKDFGDDTIAFIKAYQYGAELIKKLGIV